MLLSTAKSTHKEEVVVEEEEGEDGDNEDVVVKHSSGMKRKALRDTDNETNEGYAKAKTRNYDDVYVGLGYSCYGGDEERPVC